MLIVPPKKLKQDDGGDERQRDGRQADDGGSPLEEEGDEDERDEDAAEDHGRAQVQQRLFDERRGAEDARRHLDIGQAGAHGVQHFFELASHLEGVGVGVLLDDEERADLVVDDALADGRGVAGRQRGNLAELDRLAVAVGDDGPRKILCGAHGTRVLEGEALVRRVEIAGAAVGDGLLRGDLDLGE